nr:hypothetical protein [Candidatus Sigynarchaeota archaeon]
MVRDSAYDSIKFPLFFFAILASQAIFKGKILNVSHLPRNLLMFPASHRRRCVPSTLVG